VSLADSGALRDSASRARVLDSELARELDRPRPGERAQPSARYLHDVSRRQGLGDAAERELVAAAQAGDAVARERLVEAFLPAIAGVAAIYRGSGSVDRLELMQEGVVGLLRALERFDLSRGTPFWAYAGWWVRQAMQHLVAELTRPVVLSDKALRQLARLRDAHGEHLRREGHEPSAARLAEATGISETHIASLMQAERAPRGLDEPVGDDELIGSFGDLIADPLAEDEYERLLGRLEIDALRELLGGLSDRERAVLRERYGVDGPEQTLAEIGARHGVSAERVRQIENRALGKLRAAAGG
jgi:RNA polymerase sigma factor (sigma-70 family)